MKAKLWTILLIYFLVAPTQLWAQESPGRFMIEAGLVGGSGDACPGQYIRVDGLVTGPISLYGMVENYRCQNFTGSANRIGVSVRLGSSNWIVRPELRSGVEYDRGDVSSILERICYLVVVMERVSLSKLEMYPRIQLHYSSWEAMFDFDSFRWE